MTADWKPPPEAVEAADDAVIEAMIEHGPDGHIDGHRQITLAALIAARPLLVAEALAEAEWVAEDRDDLWRGQLAVIAEHDEALEALAAVVALHHSDHDSTDSMWRGKPVCDACGDYYPCPTASVIADLVGDRA